MAEAAYSAFQPVEQSSPEQGIARAPTGTTAFVGRALKGPVNLPVTISTFAQYQRIFGGLWQASTLAYAVEHFFANGGRTAIIVRVANGATAPTLTLPGLRGPLTLVGLAPGSREFLRASVDFDGIPPDDVERFNLVVQRIAGVGSERIEEQEIFRRVSTRPDSGRFVADALSDSALVRVQGSVPMIRPAVTRGIAPGAVVGYVGANNDGDDGQPISDYDVIGSVTAARGIFALAAAPSFGMLCIPPLDRERDVGSSTLLVAAKFCRERQALLVVDPPAAWATTAEALHGARRWPFRADNAVMFFPRLTAPDPLLGRDVQFANCGAVAGALARSDDRTPPWLPLAHTPWLFDTQLRPSCDISASDRLRLLNLGVNAVREQGAGADEKLRTLATGNSVASDWRYLGPRRLAQFVALSIQQGTRWVGFAHNGTDTWRRARGQVEAFLESLAQEDAFPVSDDCDSYFVVCDERLNDARALAAGRVTLLFGIATSRAGEFHAFLVTHRGGESRVRAVSVNRLATGGSSVDVEIESTLLRGLAG